jgi:succinyl-diaminopimelate desuccinylase
VLELGLVGETMHRVHERVPLADLDALTSIYTQTLACLLRAGVH